MMVLGGNNPNPVTGETTTAKKLTSAQLQTFGSIASAASDLLGAFENKAAGSRNAKNIRRQAKIDYANNIRSVNQDIGQMKALIGASGVKTQLSRDDAWAFGARMSYTYDNPNNRYSDGNPDRGTPWMRLGSGVGVGGTKWQVTGVGEISGFATDDKLFERGYGWRAKRHDNYGTGQSVSVIDASTPYQYMYQYRDYGYLNAIQIREAEFARAYEIEQASKGGFLQKAVGLVGAVVGGVVGGPVGAVIGKGAGEFAGGVVASAKYDDSYESRFL